MKLVAWFSEVRKGDISLVGGKGANLGELTSAGIAVPPGFILTAEAYFRFLDESGLGEEIDSALRDLTVNESAQLEATSVEIKGLIQEASLPPDIAGEITSAYRALEAGPVAVRSSATAEDLTEASFAGQQSTYLNAIGEEQVIGAVRDCWASLFEARAIFYREQRGFQHLGVGMAVVVQRMVQSQRSGVMFTLEPVSGDQSKLLIEAVYGLGEAVVSGALTPDLYILDKSSLTIADRTIVDQERELVRNPGATAGEDSNVWLDVPRTRARAQKLTDEEVQRLGKLGRRIEQHYGTPQDIEWAEEGGRFHIVQARPITVSARVDEDVGSSQDGSGRTAPMREGPRSL